MALKRSPEKRNDIRAVMVAASLRPASGSGTPLVPETRRPTRRLWLPSDTNVRHLLSEVLFSSQLVHVHDLYHGLNSLSTFQINQASQIYIFLFFPPLLLIRSLEACYSCSGLLLCGGSGAEGWTSCRMKSCWSVSLRRSRGLRKNVRGTVSRLISSCSYLCGAFLE